MRITFLKHDIFDLSGIEQSFKPFNDGFIRHF